MTVAAEAVDGPGGGRDVRRWRRPAGAALAVLVPLGLVLSGCSGDDQPAGESAPSQEATAIETLATTVRVGEVTGRLGKDRARRTAEAVADVVDGWLDGAYVAGDYPRDDFADAFPGFTKGAARLAGKQRGLMSNAAVGDRVESVTPTRRVVRVDLLAPKGEPAGATAHVDLVFEVAGEVERTEQVRGRLLLTPKGDGWRVFGFDVERGEVRGR
ncbi:hypothetical protein [Nocardioides sp. TF02-7]|uniref:hypothetical protein n=1 Tax=Nocardioides sp. TF02-7 TaxID=2917724 RepID=UPI001F0596E8|nr:hypothetical protein [Nocardioides sp. TF02-7]UMG91965.1 hypothetical protein MF408_18415 [Nocardioides sp. TF02-7]